MAGEGVLSRSGRRKRHGIRRALSQSPRHRCDITGFTAVTVQLHISTCRIALRHTVLLFNDFVVIDDNVFSEAKNQIAVCIKRRPTPDFVPARRKMPRRLIWQAQAVEGYSSAA